MKHSLITFIILIFCLINSQFLIAQEEEEKGNVFTISTYKVRFDHIGEVLKLWEAEWKPLYTQNEHVKSVRIMRHLWGSDWTLVVISEYESMGAIEEAQEKAQQLRKNKYPDDKEWEKLTNKIQSYFMGHFDDLVREVPALRK